MGEPVLEERTVTVDPGSRASAQAARLEQILRRSYPGLTRLLFRRCANRADAMDILHEAIRITIEHEAQGRVARIEQLPGYVFRTALNLLRNHRRVMCNRPGLRTGADGLATLESRPVQDSGEEEVMAQEVRRALEDLQMTRDRLVITRFYLEERTKAEICRELGIAPTHFDKVIHRARRRMRQSLAERGIDTIGCVGLAR